ncbi:hypothetical protein N2152v2_010108 [Parachlorella kessleri]
MKACGGSWAFAAASAVESKVAIEQGRLLNLSRQQLLDCVDATTGFPSTDGCNTGSLPPSQLVRLSSLPRNIVPSRATSLMEAVSQQPVVVALWWPEVFDGSKGIYNGPCPDAPASSEAEQDEYTRLYGQGGNAYAVVVGYNASAGIGVPGSYWKLKTSWNPEYKYLALTAVGNGECGILSAPIAP